MMRFRSKLWRFGSRASVPIVIAVAVLALAGGSYALFLGGGNGPTAGGTVNLSKGLVGWWKLDGNLNDSTPYATVCTPQFFSPDYVADRHDTANSAMNISARLGASCGEPSALKLSHITISAWVDPTSWNSGGNTIAGWNGGINLLYFTSDGYLKLGVHDSSNNTHVFTSSSSYSLNQWYHVAATYDGSTVVLYVNGTAVSTTSYTGGIGTNLEDDPYTFDLAGDGNTADGFIGSIDDIRVYNRAINTAEVKGLYDGYDSGVGIDSLQKDLIGWWKLKGNMTDSTPYGDNGTSAAAPTPTTDREGVPNAAYSFNGSQYIAIPNFSAKVVGAPGMTLTGWVKPPNNPGYSGYFGLRNDSNADFYVLQLNGTNNLECRYRGTDGTPDTAPAVAVTPGVWQMVTIVYTGSTVGCYVNAVAGGTTATSSAITNTGVNLDIAAVRNSPNYLLNGSISDVRFYKRALSQTEITNLYNSYNSQISLGGDGQSTTTSINLQKGLVGYWPFNGNAKDATPYSNNGVVSGATLTTDRKGRANSAYSFNGTNAAITFSGMSTAIGSQVFSVSAWLLPGSTSPMNAISRYSFSGPESGDWNIGMNDLVSKSFDFAFRQSSSTSISYTDPNYTTGQWYFVTVTCDGTNVKTYVNAQDEGDITLSSFGLSTEPLTIGSSSSGSGYWDGKIDDVRVYNRALSATEVQALYNEYQ